MNTWILEIGNTRAKWARFEKGQPLSPPLSSVHSSSCHDFKAADAWRSEMEAGDRLMITGSGPVESWTPAFPDAVVLRQGNGTFFKTSVQRPETLGIDRIANIYAVISGVCPDADPRGAWLIVDAGTCITVDLVVQGNHEGGTISPGIGLRLQSMNRGTSQLPFPEWPLNHSSQYAAGEAIGLNTFDALYSGCVSGASLEIQGKWSALREKHPNLGVILTGGDHSHLELRSILPKFADAFLTLKGYHALFHNILQQT